MWRLLFYCQEFLVGATVFSKVHVLFHCCLVREACNVSVTETELAIHIFVSVACGVQNQIKIEVECTIVLILEKLKVYN